MSLGFSQRFSIDVSGRAIEASPVALMQSAAQAYQRRDAAEAERACLAVLAREPRHFDARHLLGVVCLDGGRLDEAIDQLARAVGERPDDGQANYHLGTALLGAKRFAAAEAALRRAVALRPGYHGALVNLGNALAGIGRHDEAIDCYRRVLATDGAHLPARFNLGRSLLALDRLDLALADFRAALALAGDDTDPDRLADIHANLAQALAGLGRWDEALAACRAIAGVRPQVADWNESLILLLLGRYAEGWRKYEGRWGIADHDPPRADARVPMLAEVAGRRVLLTPEQGHGDMIQFARYAPLLAAQGAHVVVQTYAELVPVMRTLDGVERVIALDEPEPAADIVTPLLSLPLAFDTRLETVPAQVPYLHAPAGRLAAWQQRLGPRTAPRVGLCWWGSQHIPKRSLPIETLLPVLSIAGIEVHALQKEIPAAQRDWLDECGLLHDHSGMLADYADTAALIALLDLVVTIDTSVAHLAGALGKPVWIMLPHSADWRWLLGRNDSPWYPTARLFRQQRAGDWGCVVAEVAQALRDWAEAR
ncbi:MAG TPA: tetratricopeptide repeat-containing glycosyltransferase family protein [Acetobacteraceae bacterium]|jgi:tetratricopeptide (TPR) repeat protein|nr:tetratricopeptide repeat-containing glycosyltransferase family protein [Acetobacteraceae bacterium]